MPRKKVKLKGIGGWLIIPTIGLFLTAGIYAFLTILYALVIENVTDLLLFLLFIAISGITIYTLILEFKESKEFPKWFKFYLWFSVFAVIILSVMDGDYSGTGGSIIFAIIWTWYISVSKRVKNTFVK